jgi:hypothetical protein
MFILDSFIISLDVHIVYAYVTTKTDEFAAACSYLIV